MRNRLVATEGEKNKAQVLLDENLVRGSCEAPLYINASDKVGENVNFPFVLQ